MQLDVRVEANLAARNEPESAPLPTIEMTVVLEHPSSIALPEDTSVGVSNREWPRRAVGRRGGQMGMAARA